MKPLAPVIATIFPLSCSIAKVASLIPFGFLNLLAHLRR